MAAIGLHLNKQKCDLEKLFAGKENKESLHTTSRLENDKPQEADYMFANLINEN